MKQQWWENRMLHYRLREKREKSREGIFFERALRWKLHWIRLKAGLLNQRRITKEGRTFEALQTEGPRIRCMQSHGTWQTHRRKLIEAQTSRCADRRSYQKRREIVLLWKGREKETRAQVIHEGSQTWREAIIEKNDLSRQERLKSGRSSERGRKEKALRIPPQIEWEALMKHELDAWLEISELKWITTLQIEARRIAYCRINPRS